MSAQCGSLHAGLAGLALPALLGLAACSVEPALSLTGARTLVVGQRATLRVASGGKGADLDERTLKLQDAAKTMYGFGAAGLEARKISARELSFAIPPGCAAGEASLEVATQKGPVFSGKIQVQRRAALRDASGKVWVLAVERDGVVSAAGEIAPGELGGGGGQIVVAPSGRLLATTAAAERELRLATVEVKPQISGAAALPAEARGLVFTAAGKIVVGSEQGAYLVEWAGTIAPSTSLTVSPTPFISAATLALAADRDGRRGVALVRTAPPGAQYRVVPLDLGQSPPTMITQAPLPWVVDTTAQIAVAVSGDGTAIVALNSKLNKVAALAPGSVAIVEKDLPAFQTEPIAVVATGSGTIFHVINRGSRNVSVVEIGGGQINFGQAIDLGASPDGGAPVGIVSSRRGEELLLLEHDLLLVSGGAATRLRFPALFVDKKGDAGVSVLLQP